MQYSDELIKKAITQSLASMALESDFKPTCDIEKVKARLLGDEKNGSMGRLSYTRNSSIKK